jgi:hypothetical protein
MVQKIAVYLQYNDEIASFYDSNKIAVFERGARWNKQSELIWGRLDNPAPAGMRRLVGEVVAWLGDCRIIAGGCLSGLAYNEFDRKQFHIFDIASCEPDILDAILSDLEWEADGSREDAPALYPVETGTPGIYVMDLASLQAKRPDFSSKAALADFFRQTPFWNCSSSADTFHRGSRKNSTTSKAHREQTEQSACPSAKNNRLEGPSVYQEHNIQTPYGVFGGIASVEYNPEGMMKSIRLNERNIVMTHAGNLVPAFGPDTARSKSGPSITFYPNGMIRSVSLDTQQDIETPIGEFPAELLTFYDTGNSNVSFR